MLTSTVDKFIESAITKSTMNQKYWIDNQYNLIFNGYFFVKLDFEIAVDQQTKTSDRTFEGVPDANRQTVPAGQPRPYLVQIRPNLAKYPEHAPYPYFMCSSCS